MRRDLPAYVVVALALFGVTVSASASPVQGGGEASATQDRAGARAGAVGLAPTTLVRDLKKAGFRVNPGYPVLFPQDATKCATYTYPATTDCFANNPTAPYVIPIVKSWPNEYVEPSTVTTFGPVRDGYGPIYRLNPREAVVIYGRMPPPGRYMGLQTWEWSRPGQWNPAEFEAWAARPDRPLPMQYLFNTTPVADRESGRVITFSALGDIVNNVVMQRRSGYPFGRARYFIITPSVTTDRAVRRALQARGVPGDAIFTEQIPTSDIYGRIGPLGMGKGAIDFITAFRYALPAAGFEQSAAAWRGNPPLTVMRVRAPSSSGPVRPYGTLRYEPHRAQAEFNLVGDLQNLVGAVCSRTSTALHLRSTGCEVPTPVSSVLQEMVQLDWTGPYCRAISMNCNADNADAAVYLGGALPLDSGQVYAVVDTLGTETGNATYTALSVNDASKLSGVLNLVDATLKGSADAYAESVKDTDKFYVHFFTRDCAPLAQLLGDRLQDCTAILPQMVPERGDTSTPGDPALKGMFTPSVRDYIVPGTARGPDPSVLLNPRILTFTTP